MKVKFIIVGKTVEKYLQKGIDIYVDRLGHYTPFEMVEVQELKQAMKLIRPSDWLVLLDENGKMMTSKEWARDLEQKASHLSRDVVFLIGGPFGFTQDFYDRADEKLSLSKMTFSHQMVRLIFLEQLYRAFTIIKGEPYHHE